MTSRARVTVLQHRLLHYRVGLFERLRAECDRQGIDLRLVHGQPSPRETHKKDTGTVRWADQVTNRWMSLLEHDLLWQPLPPALQDSDLFVIMQENRILSNYPLVFRRLLSDRKVAYWGHGANLQSLAPSGLRERWKRLMANRVDWWFAYTQRTEEILREGGYPPERITCLNNAIDQDAFKSDLANVSTSMVEALRSEIGAEERAPVGVHCGSLYWIKRLDLLVEAADRIHAALPLFRLVIVGDGPEAAEVRQAAQTRPWLKWVGARKGIEKAAWFRVADVVLNPGAVGLHVLDSFCAGVPIVTTRDARHGPEISYLGNGSNGLVVPGTAEAYADAVISLLRDRTRLESLKRAALQEARRYTLDNMVGQFVEGISRCLAMPKKSFGPLRSMAH
jgi:glycosyltransferase involved in cell wall biosynthesis